jgi:hypothetical protein
MTLTAARVIAEEHQSIIGTPWPDGEGDITTIVIQKTRRGTLLVAPHNPVFLNGSYGGMINSAAMRVSGIDENSSDAGIVRDKKTGLATGLIRCRQHAINVFFIHSNSNRFPHCKNWATSFYVSISDIKKEVAFLSCDLFCWRFDGTFAYCLINFNVRLCLPCTTSTI